MLVRCSWCQGAGCNSCGMTGCTDSIAEEPWETSARYARALDEYARASRALRPKESPRVDQRHVDACYRCGGAMRPQNINTGEPSRCTRCGYYDNEYGAG